MSRAIKNAIITSAKLYVEDRIGYLTITLGLDFGDGAHQGFGQYRLYVPPHFQHHNLLSICGHFIYRILQIAGVDDWSSLAGKTIRVDSDNGEVYRIGHIVKDDWFDPEAEFEEL